VLLFLYIIFLSTYVHTIHTRARAHTHTLIYILYYIYIYYYYDCIPYTLPVSLSPIIRDRIARTPRQKHVIVRILYCARWVAYFIFIISQLGTYTVSVSRYTNNNNWIIINHNIMINIPVVCTFIYRATMAALNAIDIHFCICCGYNLKVIRDYSWQYLFYLWIIEQRLESIFFLR